MAIDLKPTKEMAEAAERGLRFRREGNNGGTAVGIARARDIANRKNLSEDTVIRMYSFFKRHEVNTNKEGFNAGEKGFPTPARVAWDLWGGDPGYRWATRKRDEILRERGEK